MRSFVLISMHKEEVMRLRQIWRNKRLVGLKLDKSSQDFIKLDEQLVKLFIEHVNDKANNITNLH
jgi:hypothetical protein